MLRERALAKINFDLHIMGKRADGYHNIYSHVLFADLADELTFQDADGLQLRVEGQFAHLAGDLKDNLVMRAARALQAHAGIERGANIQLTKHIPVGAGLGGGSADAAATLRGLNQLWQLGYPRETLATIGATLGADVPMCVYSVPLRAAGIGEEITLFDGAPVRSWIVLVYPHIKLETATVFAAWKRDPNEEIPDGHVLPMKNDLQPTAIALCPTIQVMLDALSAHATGHIQPRMSGSGTCCYHIFPDEAQAQACAAHIAADHPEWWVRLAGIAL